MHVGVSVYALYMQLSIITVLYQSSLQLTHCYISVFLVLSPRTHMPVPSAAKELRCMPGSFECHDGSCIPDRYVCDGEANCSGGEEEVDCGE